LSHTNSSEPLPTCRCSVRVLHPGPAAIEGLNSTLDVQPYGHLASRRPVSDTVQVACPVVLYQVSPESTCLTEAS
jgi:hypothetical protein